MDSISRLFVWTLVSFLYFGALGAIFGAISSVFNRRQGRVSGSYLGLRVAAAFEPLPPFAHAAIVGGVDGLSFGAVVGALLGLALAWQGRDEWARLRVACGVGLALVVLAMVFGFLAHKIADDERVAVLGLCGGGFLGLSIGFVLGGGDGLILGALLGLVLGAGIALWLTTTSTT